MSPDILRCRKINAFLFWGAYQLVDDFCWQTEITGYEVETWYGTLTKDGMLTGREPFVWDGPTNALKTRAFIAGSCVHDILCNFINEGLLPMALQCMADEEMYRVNCRQKMWGPRRWWTYRAVRGYQLRKRRQLVKKPINIIEVQL